MQITEVGVVGVRAAVIPLQRHHSPLRFVLFPMVHFGRPRYYAEVAERLRRCQRVVAEGYDGPSSVGLAYATALRLARQRRADEHIDVAAVYGAAHMPAVVNGLHDKFGSRPRPGGEWLTVIDL